MPVEASALATYLDLDLASFENEDAMKAAVDKVYLRRENAHKDKGIADKIFGSVNGIMRSNLKAQGKELGIEANFDDLDPTDGIKELGKGFNARLAALTTELESAKKGGKTTEEVAELNKRIEALAKENEAFKKNASEWEAKHNTLFEGITKEKASKRLNDTWAEAMGAWKPNDGISPLTLKGFESEARAKYTLDFAEDGAVKVLGKDGEIIMNKTKAQTFATLGELLKADAEALKLTGGAPQGGAPIRKTLSTTAAGMGAAQQQQQREDASRAAGRRVMPVRG